MSGRLQRWLERRWYHEVRPGLLLTALEALYARVVGRRREAFLAGRASTQCAALPVIVVGNLTVGGAGKTPLTIALVEGLRARGFRPGVISRGYGRRGAGVRRAVATDNAADVGDEPLLIARRTGVAVAVSPRRIDAARLLSGSREVDVLIADDGLQHYGLARDLEILVIDARRKFGNGRLLPAGPLREPMTRAGACDFTVMNVGSRDDADGALPAAAPISDDTNIDAPPADITRPTYAVTPMNALLTTLERNAFTMQLRSESAVALGSGERVPLAQWSGLRVHAVAGIADPERFFATLRRHGLIPIAHPFPDHHAFSRADLEFGDDLAVLMTEKDAMKCAAFAKPNDWFVPVDAIVPDALLDAVAARIRALAITRRLP